MWVVQEKERAMRLLMRGSGHDSGTDRPHVSTL